MKNSVHHEAIGGNGSRLLNNAVKIIESMTEQCNLFLKTDMFNLATFAVVPENTCRDIEDRDNFGGMAMDKFVTTRMIEKNNQLLEFSKEKESLIL